MSFLIKEPIIHGVGTKVFHLKPSSVVKDSFFTKEQADRLLKANCISRESTKPVKTSNLDADIIPDLPDITEIKLTDAKVLLNDETDVTTLHKYLDQEEASEKPRKGIVDFVNLRIRELTGFE